MRGKYITTSLKLAVLARPKTAKVIDIQETRASINQYETIWSKNKSAMKQHSDKNVRALEVA